MSDFWICVNIRHKMNSQLTLQSWLLLEKLPADQLLKKLEKFTKTDSSLQFSQEPSSLPWGRWMQFIAPHPISYTHLSSPYALLISSSLTLSFWLYLAKSTSYEAHHYAVCSNLCLYFISLRKSNQHVNKIFRCSITLRENPDFKLHVNVLVRKFCWKHAKVRNIWWLLRVTFERYLVAE
jgi:hypothetical protein